MKSLLSCLCAVLLLGAGPAARACQYCQMAAAGDPEAARLAAQVHGSESFPLEGIINQYRPVAPSANLSVPPPAASVATRASDLPTTVIRRVATPPPAAAPARTVPVPAVNAAMASPASSHWADAGLMGLLSVGGLFCWRTRRATVPLS